MNTGQANQSREANTPGRPAGLRGSGRRWPLVASLLACLVLGILFLRASARESSLSSAVLSARIEADRCRSDLRKSEEERKRLSSALEVAQRELIAAESRLERERATAVAGNYGAQSAKAKSETLSAEVRRLTERLASAEKSLRSASSDRDGNQSDLTLARMSLVQCEGTRDEAIAVAGALRSKLEDIARAIRIGMVSVVDVPRPGYPGSGGFDLESEYRKLVNEYNDLVRRFNAAVQRSNALGEIVDDVIRIVNR